MSPNVTKYAILGHARHTLVLLTLILSPAWGGGQIRQEGGRGRPSHSMEGARGLS
jgi:hypothetical protein